MRRLIILLPVVVVLLVMTTSVALAQDPDAGKTAWEQQVWQCAACHGPAGEGAFGRPLANSTATADEWVAQVRNPRRFMPSFSETQVSDQQIKDMHAYITALPDPTGDFQRKDPGVTATHPGQELMLQKNCVACHTDEVSTGQGRMIDGFVQRGITPTSDVVIKQLRTPFKNMPSYSEAQVSNDEATQIADYLNTLVSGQTPPASLPQSGGSANNTWPLAFLLLGGGLALIGFVLSRRMVKN